MARTSGQFWQMEHHLKRANRWAKNGILDHVFGVLQDADLINIQVDQVSLDSTIIQVHPDDTGA
ncbi:hypothetical protein SAMN02745866_00679 [Alteromonadaceae bacterium Bs31]|nr:hypothetical protein SAMN02745866_00679 [Alteromonadaceae bacterium Bs31]